MTVRAAKGQRVVFAEGEDPRAIRAALWRVKNGDLGRPILVGRQEDIEATLARHGDRPQAALEIRNAGQRREDNPELVDMVYARLNRKGYLRRDCQRLIHQDRNVYAASLVASGQADAMVTGLNAGLWFLLRGRVESGGPGGQPADHDARHVHPARTDGVPRRHVGRGKPRRSRRWQTSPSRPRLRPARWASSHAWRMLSYSNFGQPERHGDQGRARRGARAWSAAGLISSLTERCR